MTQLSSITHMLVKSVIFLSLVKQFIVRLLFSKGFGIVNYQLSRRYQFKKLYRYKVYLTLGIH
jgi:hypothetical protein